MAVTSDMSSTVTVLGAGNALGTCISPFIVFQGNVQVRNESQPIFLLYAGHKSHVSFTIIEWAKLAGYHFVCPTTPHKSRAAASRCGLFCAIPNDV